MPHSKKVAGLISTWSLSLWSLHVLPVPSAFSLGTLACSHSPKTRTPGWLATLNCLLAVAYFVVSLCCPCDKQDFNLTQECCLCFTLGNQYVFLTLKLEHHTHICLINSFPFFYIQKSLIRNLKAEDKWSIETFVVELSIRNRSHFNVQPSVNM